MYMCCPISALTGQEVIGCPCIHESPYLIKFQESIKVCIIDDISNVRRQCSLDALQHLETTSILEVLQHKNLAHHSMPKITC